MKPQTLERKKSKHEKILHAIRKEIESGVLGHGMAIASESELCERMKVSRGPVRQALAELQRQGLIRRQPGKGSFVNNPTRVEVASDTGLRHLVVVINAMSATPANFVASELVDGLSHAVEESGDRYRVSFQFHRGRRPLDAASFAGCQGVVVVPFTHDSVRTFQDFARHSNTPIVSVYNPINVDGVSQFYVDHEAGAFDATDLLIRYGHRRIAMLGEPAISPGPAATDRDAGFLRAITAAGLASGTARSVRVGVEPLAARANIEALLRQPDRPTALVVAGGVLTPVVLEAVRLVKLRVPQDLSIIAFDDTPEAAMNEPKLSVIKIPLGRLARLGIDSLMSQTEGAGHARDRLSIALKPELIVSQSVGPAPVGA